MFYPPMDGFFLTMEQRIADAAVCMLSAIDMSWCLVRNQDVPHPATFEKILEANFSLWVMMRNVAVTVHEKQLLAVYSKSGLSQELMRVGSPQNLLTTQLMDKIKASQKIKKVLPKYSGGVEQSFAHSSDRNGFKWRSGDRSRFQSRFHSQCGCSQFRGRFNQRGFRLGQPRAVQPG